MSAVGMLGSVTCGVALVLAVQHLWRWHVEADLHALLNAGFAVIAGAMTWAATAVVLLDGDGQQLALRARALITAAAVLPLVAVLGQAAGRRAPRWLRATAGAGAGLVALLALTTDLYVATAVTATGAPTYGPLYVPLTVGIGALIVGWLAVVLRATKGRLERAVLLLAVGVPTTLIATDSVVHVGPHELVWAIGLAPFLLAVEVVRWRAARADLLERAAAARERQRLLHELAMTNEDLQVALRTRTELLDATSHELRTPLTALLGFAQTLRTHGGELDDAKRADIVDRLGDNAQRLRGVIDGMLAAQSLRSNSYPAIPEAVLLGPVLHAATTLFPAMDGAVEIVCPADLAVFADALHVPRIVTSVIANAADHGAPPYRVEAVTDGSDVTIRVTDGGPGIDDAFLPRLFEPFERASSGINRTPGGIGLGLANAAALAASCGGSLLHDPRGPGTTFAIVLPDAARFMTSPTT